MSTQFELELQAREQEGTGACRRLRNQGILPVVLYGAKEEPVSLMIEHRRIAKALEDESFVSSILTLKVDGKPVKAVLKGLQRHPFKPRLLHADFLRVNEKEKITMNVPLHFMGEEIAPGVKQGSGIVSRLVTEIEVLCLPANLPEFIEVDMSKLELDQTLHLSEVTLPKGVELPAHLREHDMPVVAIHQARGAQTDDTPAAGAASAGDADAAAGGDKA